MIQKIKLLNFKAKLFVEIVALIFLVLVTAKAHTATYKISENGDSIGGNQKYTARNGERLLDIALRFDIGGREIAAANPRLKNRNGRLPAGTVVNIPAQFKLPSGPRQGIVLNIAKTRVFYFHPDGVTVSTYPVGVGKQGWSTPLGSTSIVSKVAGPSWTPPPSIRREAQRRGKILPAVVRPGPRNPLGKYAMHLGFKRILMHGTIQPTSIGLRSSHGCIRMFNKDIADLYSKVPVGTNVRIIYEP